MSRHDGNDRSTGSSSTYGHGGSRSMGGNYGENAPRRYGSEHGAGSQSGRGGYQSITDEPSTPGHYGRGPKGYTRSDERLKEDVSERLSDDLQVDASEIELDVREGTVTLTGTVDERWMKHHVEDLVHRCHGVKEVENRLRVGSRGGGGR